MAYELMPTDTYERELGEIIEYHRDALQAESAARDPVGQLDDASSLIAEIPELKAVSTKPVLGMFGLREWYVKNYVLIYRIDGNVVYLEHLFHQSQDFEKLV